MRSRRKFLKAAAGAASFMIVRPELVRGAPENSRIELGIIGCGGRGHFIADKFNANVGGDVKFVAAHDAFEDRLESLRVRLGVEKSRSHAGLPGYQELLASKVDAVIITSPPYFLLRNYGIDGQLGLHFGDVSHP